MSDAPTKPISDTKEKDKETLVSIVKEMTESMTGAQSTRHWAEDALWFDIPPFASRGIPGQQTVLDRLLDVLLVMAIRASFEQSSTAPRWYRAASEPRLGRALQAMHDGTRVNPKAHRLRGSKHTPVFGEHLPVFCEGCVGCGHG
jgi:hypothetical protein